MPSADLIEAYRSAREAHRRADWVPTLRILRVIALEGRVLYDAAVVADDEIEDMIDDVGIEYLDVLLDLTGDDYMGAQSIEARFLVDE
ncbi:MAG: hypothetical protein ACRD0A_02080 [Acidimicrobiales bacterium]